jgi:hypothetical protein
VHPALMVLTVTATGNHFLFDAAAGIAIAALTALLLHRRRPSAEPAPVISMFATRPTTAPPQRIAS